MAQEPTGAAKPETTSASGELTDEDRDALASKLVERYALWSGAAGLIPIPFVDMVTVGGVQLQMLRRLSEMYGVPFSENRGKSIIASLAGCLIPATSSMGAASALKVVPIFGAPIGALTMPALSAGATYAIGRAFIQHFASGGTLLDFNPPDYRDFLKTQREKWSRRSQAAPAAAEPAAPAARGGSGKGAAST